MTDDLVKQLRKRTDPTQMLLTDPPQPARDRLCWEAADRIEQLEKGFSDILTLDDPMLMKMIAKACLTGAIDDQGKYCFVPPFALGEKK